MQLYMLICIFCVVNKRAYKFSCIIEFIEGVGGNNEKQGFAEHLTDYPNGSDKFNNKKHNISINDSIYHMILKLCFILHV